MTSKCYWGTFEGGQGLCVPQASIFQGEESLLVSPGEIRLCPKPRTPSEVTGGWTNRIQEFDFESFGKFF